MKQDAAPATSGATREELIARLERLPVSRLLIWIRVIVGTATFFDGYTTLAIAFALPALKADWDLSPGIVGWIISSGYLGQLLGAVSFGGLAERSGRLRILTLAVILYAVMNIACVFAPGPALLITFRFIQGIGTGGEVPVASAYINEFANAEHRGRFFLLYEVIFVVGLMFSGLCGYILVPRLGWQSMFWVGALPAVLTIPLRALLPESPRWLLEKGRTAEAANVIFRMEDDVRRSGTPLPAPGPVVVKTAPGRAETDWRELFRGIYRRRTFMLWALWFCSYAVNNGMVTWLPTLYTSIFHVPLDTSLLYGWVTSVCGVVTSLACALLIDRVGRRPWYVGAFFLSIIPLVLLTASGAGSAVQVWVFGTLTYAILQTVTYSLYLYTAELYPTRLRAIGSGFGSAWLRLGSSAGPVVVGTVVADAGVGGVFAVFAVIAAVGGIVCAAFGIEAKGRLLEELSP
ncbi:MAG: MFS transporter [Acidisphaera sp.]|nr:MFS transporter [Acidisphaera sp.]